MHMCFLVPVGGVGLMLQVAQCSIYSGHLSSCNSDASLYAICRSARLTCAAGTTALIRSSVPC